MLTGAMAAFDGLREAARTAAELAGRARDAGFIMNARRTLLPLPVIDRPAAPPRHVFPATRARPAPALRGKRVAVAGGAGGGRTVALIGVARAFEEARVQPVLVSACSGSVLWAAMWAAGLSAREMADFSLSWRPQDYLGIQWTRAPRAAIAAARGFAGIAKGPALESLFDRRLWHMTAGETEFALRTRVYNLDRRRLETFGSEQTPDLRLGELVRIAMASPSEAVRVEGKLYVDGGTVEAQPATRLMIEPLDQVFALDVSGRRDVRPDSRLIPVEPFDDLVSSGMDLYDLFIDRRRWPELMLAGYQAGRDALTPFTRSPAQRRARGREASGS
jgi:NTE family protein